MTRFHDIIGRLSSGQVEFVVIGGLAVIAHGHVRATSDVDICYARSPGNVRKLAAALTPLHPRLRGAPADLPFFWDEDTLRNGLNFTLTTDVGDVDLLGEVAGLGGYADIVFQAVEVELYGAPVLILGFEDLVRSKAAAGRAKDLLDLEALRAMKAKRQG